MSWLLIGLGGAVGTLMRYGLTLALAKTAGTAFPFGTLLANALGSFLLGVVAEAFAGASLGGTDYRLILGVGVMGGFTTYSSFNLETLRMVEQGEPARALLYALTMAALCLGCGVGGIRLGRLLAPG
ncbi:MAG: fluoride efflux transporter CrcB [Myxococcales bacterium]|nr:fluoride efflux transporter CrcB [Myxococcales bacterium]